MLACTGAAGQLKEGPCPCASGGHHPHTPSSSILMCVLVRPGFNTPPISPLVAVVCIGGCRWAAQGLAASPPVPTCLWRFGCGPSAAGAVFLSACAWRHAYDCWRPPCRRTNSLIRLVPTRCVRVALMPLLHTHLIPFVPPWPHMWACHHTECPSHPTWGARGAQALG